MLRYLPFLLVLALWIYTFIDCLNTPENEVRNLPKLVWVAIIVLFGSVLFGPLAWLFAGRPRGRAAIAGGAGGDGFAGGGTVGGWGPRRTRWVAPDDNPDFLRSLGDDRADGDERGGRDKHDDGDGDGPEDRDNRDDHDDRKPRPDDEGGDGERR